MSAQSLAAAASLLASGGALAAKMQLKSYSKALLVDEFGQAVKAAFLVKNTNYVFHYPFQATPVFLLKLEKPAKPLGLQTRAQEDYAWPGGVGSGQAIVAFSAICAHHLVYPTPQLSFISFRPGKSGDPGKHGELENVIHCCADHSQYDPAQGARVLRGPATQPLCAVLLQHDPKADTLTAYGTLGGELFDEFFKKYEAKLSIDVGSKAKNAVASQSTVRLLDKFCKNTVRC